MIPRALVFPIAIAFVLSACGGRQRVTPQAPADLMRWVPSSANTLVWLDLDGFRHSSLDELMGNDMDALSAVVSEFGGTMSTPQPSDRIMSQALLVWQKLDAVLLASKSRPTPPAGTLPPAEPPPDEGVAVLVARWTPADLDALAEAARASAAASATPTPAPPPPVEAPPLDAADPMTPPDGGGLPTGPGLGEHPAMMPVPTPTPTPTPPPASFERTQIAGRAGWAWGTSVLVPMGGGIWLLGERPAIEQRIQSSAAASATADLTRLARDVGVFDQTLAFVGRQDLMSEAESYLPAAAPGRTPWPEVISPGDWFAVGVELADDARLRVLVAPSDPARLRATETRMSAWRDRFVQSGIAGLVYMRDAFAEAQVTSRDGRVELEALIERDHARLAYARVAGLGLTAAVVAYAFVAALGSAFGSIGSGLGDMGAEPPPPPPVPPPVPTP